MRLLFILTLIANVSAAQLLTNSNVLITINPGVQLTAKGDIQNNFGTVIDNNGSIDLNGNWINNSGNSGFAFSQGLVIMNGINQNIDGNTSTTFNNLDLHNATKTMMVNTTVGGIGMGMLSCNDAILDVNSNTLSILSVLPAAITRTTGYILSEDVDNSSKVWWLSAAPGIRTIPFGNVAGEDVLFAFNVTVPPLGANAGSLRVSTYATAANNTPYPVSPVTVTHVSDATGIDNSTNTVDRFWHIEKMGVADYYFSYAPSENAVNGNINMRAQVWNPSNLGWDVAMPGQLNPTIQSVYVPNIPVINQFVMEGATWTIASQSNPLPVELLRFTVDEKNNSEVQCKWSTASEINNDYFVVMRGKDANHFEEIGIVDGAGNSNAVLDYAFTDKKPHSGISYYRLKQVDFNGDYSYSQIEKVRLENDAIEFSIFPNPTSNNLFIQLEKERSEFATFELTDVSGKIVKSGMLNNDSQLQKISLTELSSGFYFIGVKCESRCFKNKIQVIK